MKSLRALGPKRNLRARGFVAAAFLLGMATAHPVHAQTAEAKAGARAAAKEGNDAFGKKDWAKSLDLFTRAESLMHAPTHVLMIARSQVALGHLVDAHENYAALARETLAPNAPAAFKGAQADGAKELVALEPRVPTVNVTLSDSSAKNVAITMDGEPFPTALIGIARPVDPGTHVFKARGQKVIAEENSVKVDEGAHVALVLALHAAPDDAPAAIAPTPTTTAPVVDQPASPPPSQGRRTAGYVGIGLGVVGLGVGAVFMGLGFSKRGQANDAYTACGPACVNGTAQAESVQSLDSSANTKQTIGFVGLVAGGALAIAGVTLLVLSPKTSSQTSTGLWIGPGSTGVKGTF